MLSFLLVLAWLGLVQAAARLFQKRRAEAREGWWRLNPGPYEWFGLVAGLIVSSVLTLVSQRPGTPLSQTAIAAFFDCVTIALAVGFARVEVRWNHAWGERRDVLGRLTRIGFGEIARIGVDPCGRTVLKAFDGSTIPVSPYANGYCRADGARRRGRRRCAATGTGDRSRAGIPSHAGSYADPGAESGLAFLFH